MQDSNTKMTAYEVYARITKVIYEIMVAICIACLATEIFAVLVMVVGRYVFSSVPLWCDQLSLMALIWMAIISISLAIYDETHMRVELIDMALSKKAIDALKYFANLLVLGFSALMIVHGIRLVKLNWRVMISGFHVSTGYMYLPLIICGVVSCYMSIFCIIRRWKENEKV